MNDPKYYIQDNKLHHLDGYELDQNEPLMLLRGKDIGALIAIYEYIEMLEDQPKNDTTISHLESSLERLLTFYNYQNNNKDLQSVGCSRKNHDSPSMFLNLAKHKLRRHGRL